MKRGLLGGVLLAFFLAGVCFPLLPVREPYQIWFHPPGALGAQLADPEWVSTRISLKAAIWDHWRTGAPTDLTWLPVGLLLYLAFSIPLLRMLRRP